MEGDSLQHVERAAHGLPLYPAPGGEFIALAYQPLYYFCAAPLYLLCGDSLFGPRLLSCVCAVASGGLVGWVGWRESRSAWVPLLAAALYFAGYRIMDACLTCALPDALLLFWLLAGFVCLAYGTRWWHDVLWLVFFTLAFWTKQHGAFYFASMALY